jgi:hypothetical protein
LLTLITCYPFDFIGPAPKRFVVQAWETQSSQIAEPGPSLASAWPTSDSSAQVSSASSTGPIEGRLISTRSAPSSPPTRIATALAVSAPVVDRSESTPQTAEGQQDDPPAESHSTSHKKFRKIRAWLGSIPHHLRQN